MRECVGLSVGATNLVAARADGNSTIRPAAVTWRGAVLTGFVERFGDPVPIVAADGSSHTAERLLVEALTDLRRTRGRVERTCVAVPAHWPPRLVERLRALLPDAMVTSDAVAALTALRTHPGLPARGIVALFDFGATGTTITLADAAADFRTVGDVVRYDDFSGDLIDRAVLTHLLAGLDVDPSATSAVASLTEFRDGARIAKEQLSFRTATGLPGLRPGTTLRLTRAELEAVVRRPLDGVLAAFDDALRRNGVRPSDLAAVATAGGGARIPLVTQRLSEALRMPVTTTAHAQTVAAIGAALLGGREPEAVTRLAAAPQPATLLAPVLPNNERPAVAMAWSECAIDGDAAEVAVADPGWARPEVVFDHAAAEAADALPPLRWYQRPALIFAAAACAAVFAAVGLVVTTDAEPANASSPAPTVSATPSMSDARVPTTVGAAAQPVVTETVAAGQPTVVRYTQAPQAQRVPAPQAPAPAPQAPPPAPVTTTVSTTHHHDDLADDDHPDDDDYPDDDLDRPRPLRPRRPTTTTTTSTTPTPDDATTPTSSSTSAPPPSLHLRRRPPLRRRDRVLDQCASSSSDFHRRRSNSASRLGSGRRGRRLGDRLGLRPRLGDGACSLGVVVRADVEVTSPIVVVVVVGFVVVVVVRLALGLGHARGAPRRRSSSRSWTGAW